MSNYTLRGSRLFVGKEADSIVYDTLPVGTYTIHFDELMGYYLEIISDFKLPEKVYGDTTKQAGRILETFARRPNSTGVHLDGVKGSGKTLLVKALSTIGAAEYGIPTIVINQPFSGDGFNAFIQSIDCPTLVVFDEFEKTYDWQNQTKILTLFDGVYPSKKLFLLTTNSSRECSEFLKNRPGRMYYSLAYDVLEIDVVREVLEDQLNDKDQIPSIVKYAEVFTFLNFDMLIAIIEEMNRYEESLADVLTMLNVQPEMRGDDKFNLELVVNGQAPLHVETISNYDPTRWSDHIEGAALVAASKPARERDNDEGPDDSGYGDDTNEALKIVGEMTGGKSVSYDDSASNAYIRVGQEDLVSFDGAKGVFTYNIQWQRQTVIVRVSRDNSNKMGSAMFKFDAI